jgi:hypothetical protein
MTSAQKSVSGSASTNLYGGAARPLHSLFHLHVPDKCGASLAMFQFPYSDQAFRRQAFLNFLPP